MAHITDVGGLKRQASRLNSNRGDHLNQDPQETDPQLVLHKSASTDDYSTKNHRPVSFESPGLTSVCNAQSTSQIAEAVQVLKSTQEAPQDKTIPFNPNSPNSVCKLYGKWIAAKELKSDGMQCRMLQQEQTEHFVIANDQQDSMRHFMEPSAKARTMASSTGQIFKRCFWHAELGTLIPNPTSAREKLCYLQTITPKDVEGKMLAVVCDKTRKGSPLRSED